MWPKQYVSVGDKIWGRLPSGEIEEYDTVDLYFQAYKQDEDYIYDGMAYLDAIEYPEDFVLTR